MNENVKPGPGGWADIQILRNEHGVDGAGRGLLSVQHRRARIIGPFAIHKALPQDGDWSLTHLATGARIMGGLYLHVFSFAKALKAGCEEDGVDPTLSDVKAQCAAIGDTYARVKREFFGGRDTP